MNGRLNPLLPATLELPPLDDFIERYRELGVPPDDLVRVYSEMQRHDLFRNDEYQVNIDKQTPHGFGPDSEVWHLSIKRLDKQPIHDWRDLQAIKDMLVGPEYEALELYPADSRLIDTANQYHLFAIIRMAGVDKPLLPIGWTCGRNVTGPEAAQTVGARQRAR